MQLGLYLIGTSFSLLHACYRLRHMVHLSLLFWVSIHEDYIYTRIVTPLKTILLIVCLQIYSTRTNVQGTLFIELPADVESLSLDRVYNFYANHNRHLRRDMRFYLKQIPCKVALIHDGFSVEVLKPHFTSDQDVVEHKFVCALSKPVPVLSSQSYYSNEQSVIPCQSSSMSLSSLETYGMLTSNVPNSSSFRSQDLNSLKDAQPFPKQEKSGKKACIIFHIYNIHITKHQKFKSCILCAFSECLFTHLSIHCAWDVSFPSQELFTGSLTRQYIYAFNKAYFLCVIWLQNILLYILCLVLNKRS